MNFGQLNAKSSYSHQSPTGGVGWERGGWIDRQSQPPRQHRAAAASGPSFARRSCLRRLHRDRRLARAHRAELLTCHEREGPGLVRRGQGW